MIPRILHRVVPARVPNEYEEYWERAHELHPGWDFRTWQDPIDPDGFESAHLWPHVESGAQLAGLVRLEVLWRFGGVYLDMDVEPVRSLEPLLQTSGFVCWEDERVIPDAVLGFEPGHSAVRECLDRALEMDPAAGPWATGPGITTAVLKHRTDVLALPPACFYPYHYTEPERGGENFGVRPWIYGVHRWHGSWRKPKGSATLRRLRRMPRRAVRSVVVGRLPGWARADELRALARDALADTVELDGSLADGDLASRWAAIRSSVAPATLDLVIVAAPDLHDDPDAAVALLTDIRGSLHVGGSVLLVGRTPSGWSSRWWARPSDAMTAALRVLLNASGYRDVRSVRAGSLAVPAVADHRDPDNQPVAVAAIR